MLLRDLNAPETVRNRVEAVRAALGLARAPDGWADDLAVLLALVPADDVRVRTAAERVAGGVLALLRERAPGVDPQPELARYLADGTLELLLPMRKVQTYAVDDAGNQTEAPLDEALLRDTMAYYQSASYLLRNHLYTPE